MTDHKHLTLKPDRGNTMDPNERLSAVASECVLFLQTIDSCSSGAHGIRAKGDPNFNGALGKIATVRVADDHHNPDCWS